MLRRGGKCGKLCMPALKQNKHFNHGKRAAARQLASPAQVSVRYTRRWQPATVANRMLQLISAWRQRRSATRSDEMRRKSISLPPALSLSHMHFWRENMRFLFSASTTTQHNNNNNCIINEGVRQSERRIHGCAVEPQVESPKLLAPAPRRRQLSRCVKQAKTTFKLSCYAF